MSANSPREPTLGILIDAENTPHDMIALIISSCAPLGRTKILRAYGDWGIPTLAPWRDVFKEFPITPYQQFHHVSGKNSSDSAMNIDGMDILRDNRVDTFVLVTSDSDFTKLATRGREEGLRVVGIGKKTAPRSFVNACDQFTYLESLRPEETKSGASTNPAKPISDNPAKIEKPNTGRDLLLKASQAWPDEEGLIIGAQLGALLRRLDPAFTPRNYGLHKLAEFVSKYPDIIAPTGERRGLMDPIYKFKKSEKAKEEYDADNHADQQNPNNDEYDIEGAVTNQRG
jgi:uncharacterized LabA/DUF88 family protein